MTTRFLLLTVMAILGLSVSPPASAQCTGDLTGNGTVDGADLSTLLAYWGPRTQDPPSIASDLNGDARIDGGDLSILLASWGPCQSSIISITPNQGCIVGGTQITITGTYLGSTSAVTVGGAPATGLTVVNQNTVQATAPAGTLGPASLSVTTASGVVTASQQFTYMPSSVNSIAPNTGSAAGGSQITITGSYLELTTDVTIGGAPCTNLTVLNATTVTALTPAGAPGNADVVVMGGKGTITVPGGYRYVSIGVPAWASLVEAQPDPAVVTDASLRAAIAATGLAWRVRDTGTQMEMVLIPPGTFQMGCIFSANQWGCSSWQLPVHTVNLTNAFYLGRFEVTQAQWVARMGSNPSSFQGQSDSANRPVEQVSWTAVQGYLSSTGLRLPTEAEWEYACRAGTQAPFYNGSTDANTVGPLAWYSVNSGGRTHAVGGKAPNGFGLHDMLGNVREWVADWFSTYSSGEQTNPLGPSSGTYRVHRGGSWGNSADSVNSPYRHNDAPGSTYNMTGFRVARSP